MAPLINTYPKQITQSLSPIYYSYPKLSWLSMKMLLLPNEKYLLTHTNFRNVVPRIISRVNFK